MKQPSLFESDRLSLTGAIDLSIASLGAYGEKYDHWAIAYSGGKDSTATVAFVDYALRGGYVRLPKTLTILYADTRMELPPLQQTAMKLMDDVVRRWTYSWIIGFRVITEVVQPEMDDRFFVYMLGRGVPPPKNRFRWCTPQLKVEPMHAALAHLRAHVGKKFLMLTGVRLGESAARDQRIAVSCSKDSGECGQGWFQTATPAAVADTLAPLLHWRLCHVYDWLYFDDRHGFDVGNIAAIYGEDDVRTGCVGCNLASRDTALERVIRHPDWAHLSPLLELKMLYSELTAPTWRKRKTEAELRQDGKYSLNVQRMGPLTMEGRAYGLKRILDIQQRAQVDLINSFEEDRIREMWALNVWPRKWSELDADATVEFDAYGLTSDGQLTVQPMLSRNPEEV